MDASLKADGSAWNVAVNKNRTLHFFQIESVSDKTVRTRAMEKIPAHHIWMQNAPAPDEAFLKSIDDFYKTLDVAAVWAAADKKPRTLADLAELLNERERLNEAADDCTARAWQLAVLKCVINHPIYFYYQNHRLIPRPQEAVEQALAAIAQRAKRARQIESLVAELAQGQCPEAIATEMDTLLHAPDKHAIPYLALKQFLANEKQATAEEAVADGNKKKKGSDEHHQFIAYFLQQGLLKSMRDFWQRAFETRWNALQESAITQQPSDITAQAQEAQKRAESLMPADDNPVTAFSIDDEGTIEIDDAFSVQTLADGTLKIGVHIALPSLWMTEAIDHYARTRMTSVYFPDAKQTMLPRLIIDACSLALNEYRPALSLYFNFNPSTQEWQQSTTAQERIRLAATFTPMQMQEQSEVPPNIRSDFAHLESFCELARPHTQIQPTAAAAGDNNKPVSEYYDFKVMVNPLRVIKRERTAVVNVVETLMRLTNQTWAQHIHQAKVGGFFRADGMTKRKANSKAKNKANGKADKKQPPYMWLTSPLRRYVDLQNQQLLLSLLNEQPPFKEKWGEVIPRFDKRYHVARLYQQTMERHWALQTLKAAAEAQATPLTLMGDDLGNTRIRLHAYPLMARYADGVRRPRQSHLAFRLLEIDEIAQIVRVEPAEQK